MFEAREKTPLPLRHALVATMVLFLAVDLGSRIISYESLAFRAWEAATTYDLVARVRKLSEKNRLGRLRPNRVFDFPHAYGDLAAMSNRPWMRQYHAERFTTDTLGFRNLTAPSVPHLGVVVGSSFTAGSTINDDDTFPAQLGTLVGGPIFNAGAFDRTATEELDRLFEHVNLAPGATVVYEYLEKKDAITPAEVPAQTGRWRAFVGRVESRMARITHTLDSLGDLVSLSPFRVVLRRGRARLENDRIFPNSAAGLVDLATLINGDPILFLPAEREISTAQRPVADLSYWRGLNEHMASKGLHFLVVLIPTQYTIYAPLTTGERRPVNGGAYLAGMREALQAAGVPVVDATPVLAAEAKRLLPSHRYIYWRDDTHWNKDGVKLVAQAVARAWPTASAPPTPKEPVP